MIDSTLWDFMFHIEYCENDLWKNPSVRNHFHNVYEIYYLVENEVIYFIDDNVHLVKEGTVVVIPPNSVHSTRPVNDRPRKRFLIYLPKNLIDEFLDLKPNLMNRLAARPFLINRNERKHIEGLFQKLLDDFENKNGSIVSQKSLLVEILGSLEGFLNVAEQLGSNMELQDDFSGTMGSVAKYISSHYYEEITLETLSKKFFLHSAYISRAFKQKFSISYSDYLKNIRINKVMFFLKSTDISITEIAQKTGFDSTTSLCRTFKRIVGISPLRYRKIYKDDDC